MRARGLLLLALAIAASAAAGLVAAQEPNPGPGPAASSAPSKPAAATPPATVTVPVAPGLPPATVPTNALVPDEGTPPKAGPKSSPKAEEPPPPPKPDAPPLKRPRFKAAILQGIDKITAETLRFEAKVGEPVRYKGLILTVHTCETTAADEDVTDAIAHLDVISQPLSAGHAAAPARQVFRGWMYANGPALHAFSHSSYDLWLVACKTA